MKREVDTKFFTFDQNNSGGYFIENDYVACFLIIEARNAMEAVSKMLDITEGYSEFCTCCGERWYASDCMDDDDGYDKPTVYGKNIESEPYHGAFGICSTIIYYYDGTKKKLWYKDSANE